MSQVSSRVYARRCRIRKENVGFFQAVEAALAKSCGGGNLNLSKVPKELVDALLRGCIIEERRWRIRRWLS